MPSSVKNHNQLVASLHGQYGTHTIKDTNANTRTGGWTRITILADTVFDVLTDVMKESGSDVALSFTYFQGDEIFGLFTAVTLGSGKVRCYSSPQEA